SASPPSSSSSSSSANRCPEIRDSPPTRDSSIVRAPVSRPISAATSRECVVTNIWPARPARATSRASGGGRAGGGVGPRARGGGARGGGVGGGGGGAKARGGGVAVRAPPRLEGPLDSWHLHSDAHAQHLVGAHEDAAAGEGVGHRLVESGAVPHFADGLDGGG